MLEFLLNFTDYLRRRITQLQAVEEFADEAEQWRRDPLAHPAIMAMSERERADLPFSIVHEKACCGTPDLD